MSSSSKTVDYLLSTEAVRDRAQAILRLALDGKTSFAVHLDKLDDVARFVTDVTLENYPDLKIPFHSRWGHFQVGKIDRLKGLEQKLASLSRDDRARAKLDLAIVSVLLDAGSGPGWSYHEPSSGKTFARSEGLAIASFDMFMAGAFSSDHNHPLQADSKALKLLTAEKIAAGFQVTEKNPLAGLDGRAKLLRSLGEALEKSPEYFGSHPARPGNLVDFCANTAAITKKLQATQLLGAVLRGLGTIWPGRTSLDGVNLGDVWPHSLLGQAGTPGSLVPFHKLSQWLTYSLIEPIEEMGVVVEGVDRMTGLAEYRNGGLLLDRGLITLRDPAQATRAHQPSSELVIEWRALTVALLDQIAQRVRKNLGKTETDFPLARVLEGGTWWAGRKAAASLREGGGPPLKIESDGTVF